MRLINPSKFRPYSDPSNAWWIPISNPPPLHLNGGQNKTVGEVKDQQYPSTTTADTAQPPAQPHSHHKQPHSLKKGARPHLIHNFLVFLKISSDVSWCSAMHLIKSWSLPCNNELRYELSIWGSVSIAYRYSPALEEREWSWRDDWKDLYGNQAHTA